MTLSARLPRLGAAALLGAFLVSCAPTAAQKPDDLAALRKELEALKATQAAMQKDLDEIKAALRPEPPKAILDAPPGMTVPMAGAPARGSERAAIVMLEFSDFECTFCARFAREAYPSIDRDYIQTGKVRHVFRAFPLESIHRQALKAHEAAACADEQGKYWQMRDVLFANQRRLAPEDLVAHATTVGLDIPAFRKCLDSGRMVTRVRQDIDAGMRLGVQGTPLFLIGTPGPDGQLHVRKGINGAHPYSVFKQAFDDVAAGR